MSDHTSAGIFGKVFRLLAENPTDDNKKLAHEIYNLTKKYDFSNCEMYATDECVLLGVARRNYIVLDDDDTEEVISWPR